MASSVLGAPLALLVTIAVSLAGHTGVAAASGTGAGTKLEPLPGKQGAVPPGATYLGPAPSATQLPLVVTLQPRDPAALAAEAQAVSDPSSPQFHHFLTPQQFAQRYGPTSATVNQISGDLAAQGLSVGALSRTGLSLEVSGTAAQVQRAFSTPIDRYRLSSGKTGFRNRDAPELPSAIAPSIEGVIGLDTLSPPQPTTTTSSSATPSPPQAAPSGSGATGASSSPAPAASPDLAPGQPAPAAGSCTTSIDSAENNYGALDADDLAQAYSFDPLYNSSDYGAGSTVALVELSGAGFSSTDINSFAACYGISLANGQVSQVAVDGGGATGGNTVEAELDIETVLSLAPKADVEVYEGGPSDGIYNVLAKIVSDDNAKVVSASWTNGCESYVGQSLQSSENTLLQAAAVDGQSVFASTGDQGSAGCNVNGVVSAPTGSSPVSQAVDPTTGTLYVANKQSNSVSVDGEGTASNPSDFVASGSVTTGTTPESITLDSSLGKVFVANASSSTLTTFATSTCNQTSTSGCSSPTTIPSNGHLSSPSAVAANGSTLYVANAGGTSVAVYNASTNAYVGSVTLAASSVATAIAVDATNGFVYVADGSNNRVEYFNATTCNATVQSGCTSATTVTVGHDPISLAVDASTGNLYVANAGGGTGGGGVSVLSLSSHTVNTTISTGPSVPGLDGSAVVRSVALSPDGTEVLATLDGLTFPGDVLATINPTANTITATVNLETNSDTMGAVASDSGRDLVWVADQTAGDDVVQNLNLAVSDPASQPYVTAVGGTSLTALGPAPTESTWNDQLHYAEGAGGGGISKTFAMPAYQQTLGTVSGSSGTPCANSGGDCREIPDVSADANPSTGYIIYDSVNGLGWTAIGGTSAAAPLWAGVLAVVASADGNTSGFGAINPILYELAQRSPGTYLNDVTTGNNDYNGTGAGQFAAAGGYDMATGLGTPVASQLAQGLDAIPLDVAVSGTQVYGGSPTFGAQADFGGSTGATPYGVTVNASALTCTGIEPSTPITPSLQAGSDTLDQTTCSGVTLSGPNANDYTLVLTSASGDFTVTPAPVAVAVSGSQTYGGLPAFVGTASNPPAGITVTTTNLSCIELEPFTSIGPGVPAGSRTLLAASCSGVTLSGTNANDYAPAYSSVTGNFTVAPAPLSIGASSGSMTYGATPPTIIPNYSGFVNGDTPFSLTTAPACSTTATSTSPASPPTYASSCSGAADSNYTITYTPGTVTINQATLTITASSGSMNYGTTPPNVTPAYSGFVAGDGAGSLSSPPTCSTTATNTSPPSSPPSQTYMSSCSGATDPNYAIVYTSGTTTVNPMPVEVAVSGSQAWGGSPGFSGSVVGSSPSGISVDASSLSCAQVAPSTSITSTLAGGSYTLVPGSCGGVALNGSDAVDYAVVFTSASGDFTVSGGPPPPPPPAQHGYWLVGSDGGIFTFGSATFHGSTGSLKLQRPVVGITPTSDEEGYWLVASDGGIFAFGDAGFHGSIPGLGLAPAGTGGPHALNAPIVGMVPSADGGGYFMVASDGGVFAFGDAQFEGSCPGIGGCNGAAVSVVPDASGRGYWLVTQTGNVYTFGDAPYYGAPGPQGSPITAAVRTADGGGYYVLLANGTVYAYGDAASRGGPVGAVGGLNPASAIFTDSGGGGYWVASAAGGVFTYGDAPNDGSMAGTHLNGAIIAGTGF